MESTLYNNGIDTFKFCQNQSGFDLPSVFIEKRRDKFLASFKNVELFDFMLVWYV